jgi:HK97 gp10 family phage protein
MAFKIAVSVKSHMKFSKAIENVKDGVKNGLTLIGIKIVEQAVKNADFTQGYQTGRLRNSISYSIDGKIAGGNARGGQKATEGMFVPMSKRTDEVLIGTSVEYANDVEYGTSKQKAQPYLRPAFDLVQRDCETLVKFGIEQSLKK